MKNNLKIKRMLSLVLCFITVLGSFPAPVFAQTTDADGVLVYEIGDRVWVRGEDAEPEETAPEGTFWIPVYDETSDLPVTRQGLCDKQEHKHVYTCPADCALAHTHDDSCYSLVYPQCAEHSHDEGCTVVTVYSCGLEAHDHAALGCPVVGTCTVHDHSQCVVETSYSCGVAYHVHDEGCVPAVTYPNCPETDTHNHDENCVAVVTYPGCPEEAEHVHGEGCVPTVTYPNCPQTVAHVHNENCAAVTVYSCGLAAHDHAALGCPVVEVCTVHDHSQCVVENSYGCGVAYHAHDESCVPAVTYPDCTEHQHDDACPTESRLSCGKDEHTCITEGCAADCAIEEHSHTADCDMDATYYSWELVEDTSSTFADSEKGLPVHFFVALPGQASEPSGNYENYATSYWGNDKRDDGRAYAVPNVIELNPQIDSQIGIRNVEDENTILQYVDDNTKAIMARLKSFDSLTINGKTYSGQDYEIKWVTICRRCASEAGGWGGTYWKNCGCTEKNNPHIHIDAVLTKRVAPSELKLTKTIPNVESLPQVFTFNLHKLRQDSSYKPMDPAVYGYDTNFGTNGSITLAANIPAGQTSANIVSIDGSQVSFGYYKLTENTSTGWQIQDITIERSGYYQDITGSDLYIQIATDGTFKFCATYNGSYVTSNGIRIDNERRPLDVSYQWSGIPDGLAVPPASALDLPYGTSYTIDTTRQVGSRVLGKAGVTDTYDNTDSAAYYYEFRGWQYYATEVGTRDTITYNADGTPNPASINVTSDTVIHGLWVRHELPKSSGYIKITKDFVNKPEEAGFDTFYIAVNNGTTGTVTSIQPSQVGTWNEDRTAWSYDYPISGDGTYTIVEGRYDVAGYIATPAVTVTPVTGISEPGTVFTGEETVNNGHRYKEYGHTVTITLPYDTIALSEGPAARVGSLLHTATVSFTNSYEKSVADTFHDYPNLIVRKIDGNSAPLTGAQFSLKDAADAEKPGTVEANDVKYVALPEGSYTLTETEAPFGYQKIEKPYTVTVSKDGEITQLLQTVCTATEGHVHDNSCYKYVPTQKYKIEVTDEAGVDVNDSAVPGALDVLDFNTRLTVPNEQITGSLTVTKSFVDENGNALAAAAYENATIELHVHGPITRGENGAITDIGPVQKIVRFEKNAAGEYIYQDVLENLLLGEYVLREPSGSIHGYTWDGVAYSKDGAAINTEDGSTAENITVSGFAPVSITADQPNVSVAATNRYHLWEAVDFTVSKVKAGTALGLGGAQFGLFGDQACTQQLATGVTGPAGTVNFGELTVDEGQTKILYLKEISAPTGYYLSDMVYKVRITHNDEAYDIQITDLADNALTGWNTATDTLTVENTEILGQVTVSKQLAGDELPEGSYVNVLLVGSDRSLSTQLAAANNWTYTYTNLPLGSYTVTETYSSALGYSYTTTYSVNSSAPAEGSVASLTLSDRSSGYSSAAALPDSAKAQVVFTNTYERVEDIQVNPGRFTVLKRNEAGTALPDAVFTLYADEECTIPLADMPEGFTTVATSDSMGQAEFMNLREADYQYSEYKTKPERSSTYYLKETQAPAGYVCSDTVWRISLEEDHVKIDELTNNSFFQTIINWVAGKHKDDQNKDSDYEWSENNTLAVVNKPILGSVKVNKTFKGIVGDAYKNSRIELHLHGPIVRDATGAITDIGPLVKRIELTKDAGGNFITSETVNELPLGEYVIREPFASVHGYTWTGVSYLVNGTAAQTIDINGTDGFVLFDVRDADQISIDVENSYVPWEHVDFYIRKLKTGTETELAGAQFKIYNDEECTTETTDFTQSTGTGIAGYTHFVGEGVTGAKEYYLKEVTAPENHILPDTVYKIAVSHDNSGYDIEITKHSGTAVADAYRWVEATDTLWVYNDEQHGSIKIKKAFAGDSLGDKRPSEIKLSFIGNGKDQTVTLNADNHWEYVIGYLPMGRYAIFEQTDSAQAPGYTLTNTTYTITDVNASDDEELGRPTVSNEYVPVELTTAAHERLVTVTNTYERIEKLTVTPAAFTVKKVDDNGKALAGAEFTLYSDSACTTPLKADELPAGFTVSAVSDSNGEAPFRNLKLADEEYGNRSEKKETYYLKESKAPAGYDPSSTVWTVKLNEEIDDTKVNVYNEEKGFFETIVNWITGVENAANPGDSAWNNDTQTLTVTNKAIKGSLNVDKSFVDKNGTALDPETYQNASIELHLHGPITRDPSTNAITNIGPEISEIYFKKNAEGQFVSTATVSDLAIGEYVLREPFPSIHGYTWNGVEYSKDSVKITQENGVSEDGVSASGFAPFSISADKRDVSIAVKNTYSKWEAVDFYVCKFRANADGTPDSTDNPTLAGAEFSLYTDADCTVPAVAANAEFTTKATTGPAGYAHFAGFTVPEGQNEQVYYLKETKAPENHKADSTVYKVTISHKENEYGINITDVNGQALPEGIWDISRDALMVYNEEILGSIIVTKSFVGADLGDKKPAISVTLTGKGVSRTETLNETNSWKYEFDGLSMGEYTVVETPVEVEGYVHSVSYVVPAVAQTTDETQTPTGPAVTGDKATVTLEAAAPDREVTVTNTYSEKRLSVTPSAFEVEKIDEKGQPLAGAEFTLYKDKDCTDVLVPGSNVPEDFTVKATTNENGVASFTGLKLEDFAFDDYNSASIREETYYLKETMAPEGYDPVSTVWMITLEESCPKIDELSPDKSIYETVVEWVSGKHGAELGGSGYQWISGNRLQVMNQPIKGSVTVSKIFHGIAEDDCQNASIELHLHGPITRDPSTNAITNIGPEISEIYFTKNAEGQFVSSATVSDLAIGEYVLREPFPSIHGYTWNGVKYSIGGNEITQEIGVSEDGVSASGFAPFSITADERNVSIAVENTYSKWVAVDFYVCKFRANADGTPNSTDNPTLAGAEFSLYTDEDCTVPAVAANAEFTTEATTGPAGYAHFAGFTVPEGKTEQFYYLKETKAPENHKADSTVYKVIISHDGSKYDITITDVNEQALPEGIWDHNRDALMVYNEEILGSITVTKVFARADLGDKKPDISVTLTGKGVSRTATLNETNKWAYEFDGLSMGEYSIFEQDASVDGYTVSTAYAVNGSEQTGAVNADLTLTADAKNAAVELINTYEQKTLTVTPASFTVKKLDADSKEPLAGAQFILRSADGSTVATATTGADGIASFSQLKMDDLDYADYKDSKRSVSYYLTEAVAPDGYIKDSTEWRIQLSENVVSFDKEDAATGKFETVVNWITGIFMPDNVIVDGTELTVYNTRKAYPVSVKKTVAYQGLTDPTNDNMVKYSLINTEYEFVLYIDGKAVETIKLKDGEEKNFTSTVPYGSSYEVKETVGEGAIFSSELENASGTINADSPASISVNAKNTYRFTEGGNPIVLEMVKVSGDIYRRTLPGARFVLRDSNNNLLGSYESDINGRFYISGVLDNPGTYYLFETRAPAGYRAGGYIEIVVRNDVSVILNADNQPVIVRTPSVTVVGSHVFHIANNAYGVKNDVIFTPKTGDDNNMGLWAVLAALGLAGSGTAFRLSRSSRRRPRHQH